MIPFPLQNHFFGVSLFSPSEPATIVHNFQAVSGSDAADLKNNLTQTR